MSIQFVNLPTPPNDGAGTAVDVSALAPTKTILRGLVTGDDSLISIEASNDVAGTNWAPVVAFQQHAA